MTFEEFIRDWKVDRLTSLSSQTEPEDGDYMVERRANELRELADHYGFRFSLADAARPHAGVVGYVRHLRRELELRQSFITTALQDDVVLKLPACVRLGGEFVAILPTEEGVKKYSIRVEAKDGLHRPLTQDEEIALGIAPATHADRAAAAKRVAVPDLVLKLALFPEPWQASDLPVVMWQLKRDDGSD